MMETLNRLIASLREELQHYGEMLARLDEQQEMVMRRASDDLLHSMAAVQSQSVVINQARAEREHLQREVARRIGLPADAAMSALLPRLPEAHRGLVDALIQENNELMARVQQRARQNHLLLSRSLELMQRFLNNLIPSADARVYNGSGSLFGRTIQMPSLYEAMG